MIHEIFICYHRIVLSQFYRCKYIFDSKMQISSQTPNFIFVDMNLNREF